MKKKAYLAGLALAVILVGCKKEDSTTNRNIENEIPTHLAGEVHLKLSVTGRKITRSPRLDAQGQGEFTPGTKLLLTATAGNKDLPLDYEVGKTTLQWSDIETLPREPLTFSGCYPKLTPTQGVSAQFTVTDALSEASDLLLAPAQSVTWESKDPIAMQFCHAMHRLVVSFYSSDNTYNDTELNGIQLVCSAKSQCNVDLRKGSIVANSAAVPKEYTHQGKRAAFYLVPQTANAVSLKVTVQGKSYTYALSSSTSGGNALTDLLGGHALEVRIDVKKSASPVVRIGGITIAGWETQTTVEGEIEIED